MKRLVYVLSIVSLFFFSQCQKIGLFRSKKTLLFRTEIKNNSYPAVHTKFLDSTDVSPVDSVSDNVDCYYIRWDDANHQELVMKYNTQEDKNEKYGIIDGLELIKNLSEFFTDKKIYVLGGDNKIYVFDIASKETATIEASGMDFIAGMYKDDIVGLKWNNQQNQEEVYRINDKGQIMMTGTVKKLMLIMNFQVSLWDNKVYVLGSDGAQIENKQIFIFDMETGETQIETVEHADFIAGLYKNGQIITLAWDNKDSAEYVYAILDGEEARLGRIDGLRFIVNAGVALVDSKVFVLGNTGDSDMMRVYVFDFE